jgi:hypothetical protein
VEHHTDSLDEDNIEVTPPPQSEIPLDPELTAGTGGALANLRSLHCKLDRRSLQESERGTRREPRDTRAY